MAQQMQDLLRAFELDAAAVGVLNAHVEEYANLNISLDDIMAMPSIPLAVNNGPNMPIVVENVPNPDMPMVANNGQNGPNFNMPVLSNNGPSEELKKIFAEMKMPPLITPMPITPKKKNKENRPPNPPIAKKDLKLIKKPSQKIATAKRPAKKGPTRNQRLLKALKNLKKV